MMKKVVCQKIERRFNLLDLGMNFNPVKDSDTNIIIRYFCFSNNISSSYQARELKSIDLEGEAEYVKIVLHACYMNTLNLYNQVCISLSLYDY
jgi:hypothetical protein